jgi:hypothetical protein
MKTNLEKTPAMSQDKLAESVQTLYGRMLPDGGFTERKGSAYRTDATAWAILALADRASTETVHRARSRLAESQTQDGRIGISTDHPEAYWPTPLAVMAWHGSPSHLNCQERAVHFLLRTVGLHGNKSPDAPVALDPSLLGWPWIEDSFAWIETTAMALLALKITGNGEHPRAKEAGKMLMDRQLPSGGWNYGNTIVYGQELYPQIECTGIALAALSGNVEEKTIEQSLSYLKNQAGRCRTPLSLGWALLGLSAWKERPRYARAWILESLKRQRKYGAYGTTLMSLLHLSHHVEGDLIEFLATRT